MIASVYSLDRAACQKLGIRDAYGVHKAVYNLFPPRKGETRDFLYADKGGDVRGRKILILSNRQPESPPQGTLSTKEIPDRFLEHDRYGFEVTLNPSKRDAKTGKTVAILGQDALRMWLLEKAPKLGFSVDAATLEVRHVGVLRYAKAGATCTHNTATFIGQLTVTDREAFKKSFKQGIGRAKSFGFGLLQIVPLQKVTNSTIPSIKKHRGTP